MAQLCLWTKIRTKQWLVLSTSAFQCMRAGFLCPKCDNFACLQTRQKQSDLHLKRWFFFLLPSIVQAYTQPYSEGRIKLIICQISVTIHEISNRLNYNTVSNAIKSVRFLLCRLYERMHYLNLVTTISKSNDFLYCQGSFHWLSPT